MGGMCLIFTPALLRRLLGPLCLSVPLTSISWTHRYLYNPSLAAHPPPPPTPLYMQSMILQ